MRQVSLLASLLTVFTVLGNAYTLDRIHTMNPEVQTFLGTAIVTGLIVGFLATIGISEWIGFIFTLLWLLWVTLATHLRWTSLDPLGYSS